MADKLADVIAEAAKDRLLASDDKRKMHDFIAAAVRAHLFSDAVVERVARKLAVQHGRQSWDWAVFRHDARAALAAAGEG